MIYKTLEEAIAAAQEFADAFDMQRFVKVSSVAEGGYELFGSGETVLLV